VAEALGISVVAVSAALVAGFCIMLQQVVGMQCAGSKVRCAGLKGRQPRQNRVPTRRRGEQALKMFQVDLAHASTWAGVVTASEDIRGTPRQHRWVTDEHDIILVDGLPELATVAAAQRGGVGVLRRGSFQGGCTRVVAGRGV